MAEPERSTWDMRDKNTRNSVPANTFREHAQVRRQFFLSIPRKLVDLIERYVQPHPWNSEARELEVEAADQCAGRHEAVGFWNGSLLLNADLSPPLPLPTVSAADAQALGWEWNELQISSRLRVAQIRIDYFANVGRGYAGWLVTNTEFQREQAALIRQWSGEIQRSGLSGVGQLISASGPVPLPTAPADTSSDEQRFAHAIRNFLVRWRLNELTSPNLPAPAKPLMAGMFPLTVSNQLMDMGGVFHIPDTYPIPSRDELRAMLDEALHIGRPATHLEEWRGMISVGNSAKNQIERFGRVRQLYHFWALLHDRYAARLTGRREALHRVFSDYFSVSLDTIRADLRLIDQRLGADWATSGCFRLNADR